MLKEAVTDKATNNPNYQNKTTRIILAKTRTRLNMTPERYRKICTVLDKRQPDLTVLMDNVHKPHNLSAVLRTCDAVGIPEIHAVCPEANMKKLGHTSGGSKKWVQLHNYSSLPEAFGELQERGMKSYAAHLSDDTVDYREIDYTRPVALVLGAEKEGVSDEALSLVDGTISIPMQGMVQSFNVSVAAAIILSEAQRQRQIAGLYDEPRIDPETRSRLLFEWGWPQIADYCQRNHLAYPQIDEEGQIIEKLKELRPAG